MCPPSPKASLEVPQDAAVATPPSSLAIPTQAPPAASGVADIEKNLTAGEMSIVDYHRNSIKTGNVGKDPEGYPVTVYSNTIEIQDGKDKGKFVTVPGWFDGKMHDSNTAKGEDAIYNKWKDSIQKGKWQTYSDPKEADSRAKYLHQIMDLESDQKE